MRRVGIMVILAVMFLSLTACGKTEPVTSDDRDEETDDISDSAIINEVIEGIFTSDTDKAENTIIDEFEQVLNPPDDIYYSFAGELDVVNEDKRVYIENKHWMCEDGDGRITDLTELSGLEAGGAYAFRVQYYMGRLFYFQKGNMDSFTIDGDDPVTIKSKIEITDFVFHDNGYLYFTGGRYEEPFYMMRIQSSEIIQYINDKNRDESRDIFAEAEVLFEIETADYQLRLTMVKVNPDSLIFGVEDLWAEPLGRYTIWKMDLDTGDVKMIFECVKGTSETDLDIKGLSRDEIGLEYDDGCYVFGDRIIILAYDRTVDRFVKVYIDDEEVSTEYTEYKLLDSFEDFYPDVFGFELEDRTKKLDGGYLAIL